MAEPAPSRDRQKKQRMRRSPGLRRARRADATKSRQSLPRHILAFTVGHLVARHGRCPVLARQKPALIGDDIMTTATLAAPPREPLRAPRYSAQELAALKARDNSTNWRYLALNWGIMIATVASAIAAESAIAAAGYSGWWVVPIAVAAIVVMGASQHQLGGAIHEGAHYQLFANRTLNEVASDWLAGFPIFTSTHHYRLHHMPHHQFVNDTARDPVLTQAAETDHWLDFPLTHIDMVKALARLLWIPHLVRYTIGRARYSALGMGNNPYGDPTRPGHPSAQTVGLLFAGGVPAVMLGMLAAGLPALVVMGTFFALWAAAVAFYALIPESWFASGRIEPVLSHRAGNIARLSFMAIVYGTLTAIDLTGYNKAWGYYGLYWIVPLFTAFPVFMILREWLQHGNADRGRLTNTRVILANPVFTYAVMPWGMDYHLPHHMVASVPHYRLKELHALLQRDPEYAAKGVVVEGLFGPVDATTGRATAFGILHADHAPKTREQAYVDDSVLERADVADQASIDRESRASRASG
jgi:fatty acid desaturase